MEKNILKIDLDLKFKASAMKQLKERLAYMHDLKFFDIKNIKRIELIKKTSYGSRIVLHEDIPEELIVVIQLMLGSDYRKEVNTMINHFKLGMAYSNRLFTVKRYRANKLKKARVINVTQEIVDYVSSGRKINHN